MNFYFVSLQKNCNLILLGIEFISSLITVTVVGEKHTHTRCTCRRNQPDLNIWIFILTPGSNILKSGKYYINLNESFQIKENMTGSAYQKVLCMHYSI